MRRRLSSLLLVFLPFCEPVRAELVPDGGTVVIDGVTNEVSGELIVGTNGPLTSLLITNAGQLYVSSNAFIGLEESSFSNLVSVSGAGSILSNSRSLFVGSNGPGNQLIISDEARVMTGLSVSIGRGTAAGGNQTAVLGSNTTLEIGINLSVGYGGSSNRLLVSGGGRVTNSSATLGVTDSASQNEVRVTGEGSSLDVGFTFRVGNDGSGNRLIVADGGRIGSQSGYVGNAASSTGNEVAVLGAKSEWTIFMSLLVGSAGGQNRLVISNGGKVTLKGTPYSSCIGSYASATDNQVIVTGAGSAWSGAPNLHIGEYGARNRLEITDGATVANALGVLGYYSSGQDNAAWISGAGSFWSNGSSLYIGRSGPRSRLSILAGGLVENEFGFVGRYCEGNTVLVSSTGSRWSNRADVFVGYTGSTNRLEISAGAQVAGGSAYVGRDSVAVGNEVVVTDIGSTWRSRSNLFVGYHGSANRLVVTNGGWVEDWSGSIGSLAGAVENEVVVTGAGSVWSNRNTVSVGSSGSNNRLLIADGGTVFASNFARVSLNNRSPTSGNLLHVAGGTLRVQNSTNTGTLDLRGGVVRFDAGVIDVDQFVMRFEAGPFEFNGGTMTVRTSTVTNALPFFVGDGTNAATLQLTGTGVHSFAHGLVIRENATLRGCGTIEGAVTNYGTIIADHPGQTIYFAGSFANFGTLISTNGGGFQFANSPVQIMEINVSGTTADVSFQSVNALTFTLEYKDGVDTPHWLPILPSVTGTGGMMTLTDTNAAGSNRVYRVRAN